MSDSAITSQTFPTQTASTTVAGVSESATIAETDTGTDSVRHVTPASLEGSALQTKVDGIEALADVTDTANVTSVGALMDSELSSITDVKALDQSVVSGSTPTFTTTNFTDSSNKRLMTDAQETVLDNTSGTNTGDEATASTTVSGISESATIVETDTGTDAVRHVTPAGLAGSALQTKVDGVETSADVTDTANVTSAGAVMDTEVTNLADVKAFDTTDYATSAQGTTADSALQPADIASGTITARADDIDFSGGAEGDVLTVQSDGSYASETPSGGASYPSSVYTSSEESLSASTVKSYTHNLGVTTAEMQSGKYKVVLCGSRGGYGYQFGDNYGAGFWGGSTYIAQRHQFTSGDPSDQGNVNWQANTLKIDIGSTALTKCRCIIIQMFA